MSDQHQTGSKRVDLLDPGQGLHDGEVTREWDDTPDDFGRIAAEHGWSTSLDVGAVLGRWPELVGPDVAAHCTVEQFEPPVLVVRASSTTWTCR